MRWSIAIAFQLCCRVCN